MIGGRKVRSNKGKKRVSYGTRSRTRSGAKFRGRKVTKTRKTRKVRSNKGKKRAPYGRRYNSSGRTRSDVRRERPWLLFAKKGKKFSVV
jgi:hypothetical protein